jgi:hypothetical protein
MYFPPYESLINAAGLSIAAMQEAERVPVPTKLLQFLMQTALLTVDFNEQAYLQANPDVLEAIQCGRLLNARQHFFGYGYFEGRMGALPAVDEEWYLTTYPDVAQAVRAGRVISATHHFHESGAAEGRLPSKDKKEIADHWRDLLRK